MRKSVLLFEQVKAAHARLFSASLRRAHDIARDTDDAVLLAEYRSQKRLTWPRLKKLTLLVGLATDLG
jgi:hypothetical protein